MKRAILSVICVTLLTGCVGFLDEKTTTYVSESTVYSSERALEAAVYGVYSTFVEKNDNNIVCKENELLHSASGLYTLYIASTPLTNIDYSTQYLKLGINYMSQKSYARYSLLYSAVNRCNTIIENLPGSSIADEFKREIDGEARFLRAYCYFNLVRSYGDVPLLLKSPTNTAEASIPRTPFYEVYTAIVEDLKFAFENMRTYERMCAATGAASGRSCNYAAKAYLSEVYLTIGTLLDNPDDNFWDPAVTVPDFSACGIHSARDALMLSLQAAEDVIENGPYELAPTYARLFRWTVQEGDDPDQDWKLKERIMSINITVNSGAFAYLAKYSLPAFPKGTSNYTNNNQTNKRWKPSRYVFQHWCETYPGEKGDGVYNKDIYVSSSDPRLDATFFYYTYINQKNEKETEVQLYPHSSKIYVANLNNELCFKKFLDPRFDNNQGYADLYVMRFASMFLNAAEAAANLSSGVGDEYWNKAFSYIEVLHRRARTVVEGDGGTGSAQPKWESDRFSSDADPLQSLQDAIFWERVYETMLEGHEFYDTHRHGANWISRVITQPVQAFLRLDEQRYSNGANRTETYAARGYTGLNYGIKDYEFPSAEELRKSLIAGFPNEEMNANPNINQEDQNPYYWE